MRTMYCSLSRSAVLVAFQPTEARWFRLNYPSTEYSTNAEAVATATHTLNSESSNPTGDNGGTSVWWDKNPRL